jgi:hypothetical protein
VLRNEKRITPELTSTVARAYPNARKKRVDAYLYELIALSAAPLKSIESDFAVDSSGFSTGQVMRWS